MFVGSTDLSWDDQCDILGQGWRDISRWTWATQYAPIVRPSLVTELMGIIGYSTWLLTSLSKYKYNIEPGLFDELHFFNIWNKHSRIYVILYLLYCVYKQNTTHSMIMKC